MTNFTLEVPTKIYFGNHIIKEALEKEKKWISGNVMVVTTGRSLFKYGYVSELQSILRQMVSVNEVKIYDRISQNPKLQEVNEAIVLGKERKITCVIGFGGGSAIDAAKAVAVGIGTGEELETYLLYGKEPSNDVLPIIAIPTTAGTGSELSKAAIISSLKHQIKSGIRGKSLFPKAAIVEPRYTWTVPFDMTMETGFDVLAHAIESYLAVHSNMISEMISEKAIKIAASNLLVLAENLDNNNAREAMSFASMISGVNLANVGTCLPHRMQYAIGALTDTTHAAGLLALYPAWMKWEYIVNEEKIKQIFQWIGEEEPENEEKAKNIFQNFIERIGQTKTLLKLGINESNIEELTESVTGNITNDKLSELDNIINNIFQESL